ncbi:MAG: hypothetical protein JWQ89_4578, partial [Devosia sp.]|uniref:toprim domain-containing protein n=1 Tax=Devosia sp. TaxID=1871048 RepID=UPI0026159974
MSVALDRILSHFPDARKSGKGFEARCPSHDDRKPSLSIGEGDDGRVLIHCQQGCPPDRVLAALGLSLRDLWSDPLVSIGVKVEKVHLAPNGNGVTLKGQPRQGRIVATYPYVDETGELLYEVVRWNPKGFTQRRPDGRGGYEWTIKGVRRVLYRLPQLRNADPSRPVFLVEGEKDVHCLEAHGYVATTSAQGADSWSKGEGAYEEELAGRHVVILPDNDEDGDKYATEVASSLSGIATSCRIVRLPGLSPKGDISEWFDLGHTTDELDELVASKAVVAPVRFTVHWADEAWDTEDDIEWIVECLFSAGSVSILYGAPGTKKTY